MATPDLKTLLKGATTWREEHRGVSLSLSHYGYRDGTEYPGCEPSPGTWYYYLHLTEQMFRPDDWAKMWLPERETDWGITHDYHNFPEVDFHGGCTFYETSQQYDRKERRKVSVIKIGCDYAHLWDREEGYWHTYDAVLRDARHSVDLLLEQFPDRRQRCGYSGQWGEPDQFYEAVNGAIVHKSHIPKLKEDGWWKHWQPKAEADTAHSAPSASSFSDGRNSVGGGQK